MSINNQEKYQQNMQLLEAWYETIKQYPQLTMQEVKDLYTEMQQTNDKKRKEAIRNSIITGTLYVLYNHFKRNKLYFINSSIYNIQDMIEEAIYILIQKIDNGEIFNYDYLSKIFKSSSFFINHSKNLTGAESTFGINSVYEGKIGAIVKTYCESKEKTNMITYQEFLIILQSNYPDVFKKILSSSKYHSVTFLEDLYCFLEYISNEYGEEIISSLTQNQISNLIYIIYDNYREAKKETLDNIICENFGDEVINDMYLEKVREIVFSDSSKLKTDEKLFLMKRYGFNGFEPKSLNAMAEETFCTKANIWSKEKRILKKLKKNRKIKNNL